MTRNVLEWLDAAVLNKPESRALADVDVSLTYRKLGDAVERIASYIIRRLPAAKNKPIAVLIDRNAASIELFLGIAASGNFYVPVDVTLPPKRVELILETLKPVMILRSTESEKSFTWGDLTAVSIGTILGEVSSEQTDKDALALVRSRALDVDPLYAIFTSGSTGVPKGVLVNHRSVIDLVSQFAEVFPFPENAVFGNQAPFDFDVSVKDIYDSLYQGGCVEVIPKQFFSFPGKLVDYLNERKINTVIWAVSALQIVENFKTFDQSVPQYLKLIMFSGEVMPVKVLKYWQGGVPDAVYVNLYGPTEITCNCSYYIINRDFGLADALPIGKPFPNTEIFLWDEAAGTAVTEPGKAGEICVRGTCLALGYYAAPEVTAKAFRQSPFTTAYEEKVYHTGDNGFYNENGELMFVSRSDYQIKHMGHRIELGEIELAVNALDFIEKACCLYNEKKSQIVLFYQTPEPCRKEIIHALSETLPKFMLPNKLEHYTELPMNSHAKIDRTALKATFSN